MWGDRNCGVVESEVDLFFVCFRNPNEHHKQEPVLAASRERNRFRSIVWEEYDSGHQKYLEIGEIFLCVKSVSSLSSVNFSFPQISRYYNSKQQYVQTPSLEIRYFIFPRSSSSSTESIWTYSIGGFIFKNMSESPLCRFKNIVHSAADFFQLSSRPILLISPFRLSWWADVTEEAIAVLFPNNR